MQSKEKDIENKIEMYKHELTKNKSEDYVRGFNDSLEVVIKIIEYIISKKAE